MKRMEWLDNLKLRASWGQTGNQEISNIARYTIFESNYGEAGFGGQSYGTSYDIAGTNGGQTLPSGFKRNQLGNDNLKWETTTQTNVGFDFGMLRNALYGSFEWYYKKTTDILVYMPGIGVKLYRKVKAMTGNTPVDLLRKARLAQAQKLLQESTLSVSEIAYQVGFASPSYFTKCYKDEFGTAPGESRKS